MYRGGDVLETLHGSVPEWLLLLAALVTRLGDVWVLISITIAASWLLTWRRGGDAFAREPQPDGVGGPAVWLVGVVVGGLAAMTTLKYLFTLPRPEQVATTPNLLPAALEATYVSTVTLGGYGFPSGHALGATVAYGALALTLDTGTRRRRFAAAGALILAIALSRVVLAVHYPGDVVGGVVGGVAFLAAVWWCFDRSPADRTTTAFGLALVLAIVATVVSGAAGRSVTYVALAAGGFATWSIGRPSVRPSATSAGTYHAEAATLALGVLAGVAVLEGDPAAIVPAAVLGAVAVAVPTLGRRALA